MAFTFNDWIDDSYETITINDDDILEFVTGGPTDEGYVRNETRYSMDKNIVYREFHSYSRDCDGPHEIHSEWSCNQKDFYQKQDEGQTVFIGRWECLESHQRDYFAEAMGY